MPTNAMPSTEPGPLTRRVTPRDLDAARDGARAKLAMLTCYDFTTARVMQEAGVPILLVGDSAAMTILGHDATTAIRQPFLQELTAAVRRGAPRAYLLADMPFGSYHGATGRAVENVCEMVRSTGCDATKLEVTPRQLDLVERLADAGVAVWAHLGLRPQSAQVSGYRTQGRTAESARRIVAEARQMADAGAAAVLLEAVPPQVAEAVVSAVPVPVIGCGAGPACAGHVVVWQDLLGLTPRRPRFVPDLGPNPSPRGAAVAWRELVESGRYPAAEHCYAMQAGESAGFAGAAAGESSQ